MTETASNKAAFEQSAQKGILTVTSDEWSIFGPTFKTKIPVTDMGDGLYKISKSDWDATIGPVFDRLRSSIIDRDKLDGDKYRAIATGYTEMSSAQTQEFHALLQAFSAAADPEQLKGYPGTTETNKHLKRLTDFVETFKSEDAVLVNQTQLQGLANAGRKAMEFARENQHVSDSAKDFYKDVEGGGGIDYDNGLVHKIF